MTSAAALEAGAAAEAAEAEPASVNLGRACYFRSCHVDHQDDYRVLEPLMSPQDFANANDAILKLIITEGEKRLDGQVSFANSQDARSGSLVGASVSLAAAAAGIAVAAAELTEAGAPVIIGAMVATFGFTIAAVLALWASRACNFDAPGWYPKDFKADVAGNRSEREIQIDFALDLEIRLRRNRKALIKRGNLYNAATWALLLTPGAAVLCSYLAG